MATNKTTSERKAFRGKKKASRPVLVVAAWQPEFAALEREIRFDRVLSKNVVLRTIGVGLVEAAFSTAHALEETQARIVILVGTAGIYPQKKSDLTIGRTVIAGGLALLSHTVIQKGGYIPDLIPTTSATDARLTKQIGGVTRLRATDVACPLAITKSAKLAKAAAQATGCEVENLEAFAVASAAQAAKVPCAVVLGLSNFVGPRAQQEWKKNNVAAAATACGYVLTWLRNAIKGPTRSRPARR